MQKSIGHANGAGLTIDPMSLVAGYTSDGTGIQATLLRITRHSATLQIENPNMVLRVSEIITDFSIIIRDQTIYSGRGLVRAVVNSGLAIICELTLEETSWRDIAVSPEMIVEGKLKSEFQEFLGEWQKLYRVVPEYKLVVADMQTFLSDMRLWVDQVELGIRSFPAGDRLHFEKSTVEALSHSIISPVDALFERFEAIADQLAEEVRPTHRNYMRRQLHPFVLSAPFAYRAFHKPLGYAGDYQLVNMMAHNVPQGGSLFAKLVDAWFLHQPPAEAHRNRINYLTEALNRETLRIKQAGRVAKICSVACGPAMEVQKFIAENPLNQFAEFTLVDFNEETLQHVNEEISKSGNRHQSLAPVKLSKKSVQQILKEFGRPTSRTPQFDFVYCAGLFDYLPDYICKKLMDVMYEWLKPGGLLLATNVTPSNPHRHGMEHLLDWHLIYRTGDEFMKVAPGRAASENAVVRADTTGVNIFLEVRKPSDA